jgi:hypothetical protein
VAAFEESGIRPTAGRDEILEKGMINQEWKIKSRSTGCCVTGRVFADGEAFYTAIFEDEGRDGFTRRDYSAEAWEREFPKLRPFSYWRSVYQAPKDEGPKKEIVEKEGAERLLRRLIDEDDPLTENARFILAVMLERKKTLRETDSRSLGDTKLRIYEQVRSGEVFIIRDPMLRLDQIDAIQREVAELLGPRNAGPPEAAEPNATAEEPSPPSGHAPND